MITPAYEPACGGSASVHNYGVMHPDPVLLSDMTSAERGAVYRYLARFAELDDAKIFTRMVTLTNWLVRMMNAVSTQLWRSLHN